MELGTRGEEGAVGVPVGEEAVGRSVVEVAFVHRSFCGCQHRCLGSACPYRPAFLRLPTLVHLE